MTSTTGPWGTPEPARLSPGFGTPGQFGGPLTYGLPPTAPKAYGLTYWPPGTPGWPPLASPWKRLGQVLLDSLLFLVTLFVGWFVWQFFTWSDGQTPGMKLLRLRVIGTKTGHPATFGQMIVREWVVRGLAIGLGSYVAGLVLAGVGYAFAGPVGTVPGIFVIFAVPLVSSALVFSKHHQTAWDMICSTVVVDEHGMR